MIVSVRMIALYLAAIGGHLGDAGRALERRPKLEPPPMSRALASWYEDGGQTASGWHAFYGVASRTLGFGTRVLFRYRGRAVTATVDDRGPFVYSRLFDLNQNVAGALAFSGVDTVAYRIGG